MPRLLRAYKGLTLLSNGVHFIAAEINIALHFAPIWEIFLYKYTFLFHKAAVFWKTKVSCALHTKNRLLHMQLLPSTLPFRSTATLSQTAGTPVLFYLFLKQSYWVVNQTTPSLSPSASFINPKTTRRLTIGRVGAACFSTANDRRSSTLSHSPSCSLFNPLGVLFSLPASEFPVVRKAAQGEWSAVRLRSCYHYLATNRYPDGPNSLQRQDWLHLLLSQKN